MAGFLKRMFSFGRDDRKPDAPEASPDAADAVRDGEREADGSGAPGVASPAPRTDAPRTDEPVEAGMVARDAAAGAVGTGRPVERPLDAVHGPEPGPEPGPLPGAPNPDRETGTTRAHATDDPADGLDPSRSPAEPSHSVGGTADRHADADAALLERTGETSVDGGTARGGVADHARDGADGSEPSHRDAAGTAGAGGSNDVGTDGGAPNAADANGASPDGDGAPRKDPIPGTDAPSDASLDPPPPALGRGGSFSTAALFDDGPSRLAARRAPSPATATPAPEPDAPRGFLSRLRSGLGRSSRELTQSLAAVFRGRKLDDETLEELEDVLLRADLGTAATDRIVERLSERAHGREVSEEEVRRILASEVERLLAPVAEALELDLDHRPHVILVVGVNGTGKTTTIGKLAAKLRRGGLSVMLAAGDTFRAAAIEQLHLWGDRVGAEVVSSKLGADAAGLAFGAYERAREAGADVLLIDTAGRLQNRAELMDELAKVVRVLRKHDPSAPHTVLQTLDATTGQNALAQVEAFRETAGVGGLVMTKLDGTARGGVLVAVAARFGLPVWYVGVGEGVDDLEPFRADEFAAAIAGGTGAATSEAHPL